MSTLYNSLFAGLEPERFKDTGTGPDPLKMEMGLALEEGLESSLKQRWDAKRPGEFRTAQDIIYSPDFIVFDRGHRLGEIKLTWMSSKEVPRERASTLFPSKFDKWFCQMKCYCHHLETAEARLLAFFVNGPGSFAAKHGPELLGWDITFTARELQENWQMVTNNAKHVGLL